MRSSVMQDFLTAIGGYISPKHLPEPSGLRGWLPPWSPLVPSRVARRAEPWSVRTILIWIVVKQCFVVLAAVEHTDDRYIRIIHCERNYGALSVVGDPQPGPNVISHRAAMGKSAQSLALGHDGFCVLRRNFD